MKTSEKFTIIICGFLAAFFIIVLMYSFFYIGYSDVVTVSSLDTDSYVVPEKTNYIYNMFVAQIIVFLLTVLAVIAYILYRKYKMLALRHNCVKLILLTEENVEELEYALGNKSSAIIGKAKTGNKRICFVDKNNLNLDKSVDKYAVVNCVKNCWYIECLSSELPKLGMALKRGGKQCVYKLKVGYIYRLQPHDIIYIGKDRLLFESGNGQKNA